MSLQPGQQLGDLTVVGLIGEGSHAAIYKVRHEDGTKAALKVLHTTDPVAAERLKREGKALSGMVRRIDRSVACKAISSPDDVKAAADSLNG